MATATGKTAGDSRTNTDLEADIKAGLPILKAAAALRKK